MLTLTVALLVSATNLHLPVPPFDPSPVRAMISRVLPGRESRFVLESVTTRAGHPILEVDRAGQRVILRGSDGVALASAFNWYLRHVANGQLSRRGDQTPSNLPLPQAKIRKDSPYRMVNFLNYCTFCYTAAFWDWKQWEREIDLMAMSGVRNPLMVVGNELVWERVLKRLGYSQPDISKFIPGCAFTAWWLMGNLEGEGGPVPEPLIQRESDIAKKILRRMRSYGMEPVLQGFNGVVPTTLPHYLPGANIVDQGKWAGGYQRPSVLSPLDPNFGRIAQMWYEEHAKLYGKARYYGGDLFHEGGRTAGLDLAGCAKSVQSEMRRNNPDATWVLQGWSGNPPKPLLLATDPSHTAVQYIESYPQTASIQNYAGRPWTFCMVNTFGGHETLGGKLSTLATMPSHLLKGNTENNIGIGILDEGLDTNPAVYDLFSDMAWESHDVDLAKWEREYAHRRYGAVDKNAERFWALMGNDLLGHQSENLLCSQPKWGITSASSWGDATLTHDLSKMVEAGESLFACSAKFQNQATYRSDCVEAMRQLFNDYGVQLYEQLSDAYARKDLVAYKPLYRNFLRLLQGNATVFASGDYTLLGKWIAQARAKGTNDTERGLLEREARQLITLWSPTRTDLSDYAYRQWDGLFDFYYWSRWWDFLYAADCELSGKPIKNTAAYAGWEKRTTPTYPTQATHLEIAGTLWKGYLPYFKAGVRYWKRQQEKTKRWSWSLGASQDKNQTLIWDVTDSLKSIGKAQFSVSVEYQSGNNAIVISGAELAKKTNMAVNGGIVAVDIHPGRSGIVTRDNVYSLKAKELDPKAQYFLILHVMGDGGNDSKGRIVLR